MQQRVENPTSFDGIFTPLMIILLVCNVFMSNWYKNNHELRLKVFDKSISEGSVQVYFQLRGNINELGPSLLEENWRNCFPGNRRTGMDVRVRLGGGGEPRVRQDGDRREEANRGGS